MREKYADYGARVTSTYMFPYKEDLCRFDFEVDPEDEYMCVFGALPFLQGKKAAGTETPVSDRGE